MADYTKPLPMVTPDTREFWEGCKRHELVIQRCRDCGALRHYPRPMCPACGSWDAEWVRVSGRGKVYTWTVAVQPFHPGFLDEMPYASVTVELDEGVRMVSNVVDVPPEELYIGMPVEVVFEDVTEEITLPKFKRAP
ncbi:MAG: Zn-ribbon domain-containing OB-fold protein [Chloroflexota bacterium]|nr:Zn-ribbon domain-containing OB-fold protein [Chloroflexota bacterium]